VERRRGRWSGGEHGGEGKGGGAKARAVERRRARWLGAEPSAAARVWAEEKKCTRVCGREDRGRGEPFYHIGVFV
jgi:hypothetical protein